MNLKKEDRLLIGLIKYIDRKDYFKLENLSLSDWEHIIHKSQKHSLAPLMYRYLRDINPNNNIPSRVLHRFRNLYRLNLIYNMRLFGELKRVINLFNKNGIPVIVLKGAHLAEIVYGNIGMRVFGDIDLLIKKNQVKKAQQSLEQTSRFYRFNRDFIDIHWYIEQFFDVDMKKVWGRTQKASIAGEKVLVLTPEALVVHLCVHASFHHLFQFDSLKTFFDIKEIIDYYNSQLIWEEVIDCAVEWGFKHSVFLTLELAEELVGAKVPRYVIKNLKPNEFNPQVKSWAIQQIFQDHDLKLSFSPYFWQFWQPHPIREKLNLFKKLLLPSSEFISKNYPVISGTAKSRLYYFIRFKDHLIRYLNALFKIIFREENMIVKLKQNKHSLEMRKWLASDEK